MSLIEEDGAGEGSAGDGVVEGFRLGLCGGGSDEGVRDFTRMTDVREDVDFFSNSAAEVVEGFTDVRGIIVGFVGILGTFVGLVGRVTTKYRRHT